MCPAFLLCTRACLLAASLSSVWCSYCKKNAAGLDDGAITLDLFDPIAQRLQTAVGICRGLKPASSANAIAVQEHRLARKGPPLPVRNDLICSILVAPVPERRLPSSQRYTVRAEALPAHVESDRGALIADGQTLDGVEREGAHIHSVNACHLVTLVEPTAQVRREPRDHRVYKRSRVLQQLQLKFRINLQLIFRNEIFPPCAAAQNFTPCGIFAYVRGIPCIVSKSCRSISKKLSTAFSTQTVHQLIP